MKSEFTSRPLSWRIARVTEVVLGLTFLLSALSKGLHADKFAVQIWFYRVLWDKSLLPLIAWSVIGIESAVALGFIAGLAHLRKLLYPVVHLLLIGFTALILYGWIFHDLKDCGCFGNLEMSPLASILKNVVLLVFCITLHTLLTPATLSLKGLAAYSGFTVAIALVIAGMGQYANRSKTHTASQEEQKYAEFQFQLEQTTYDLSEGDYLVAVISATCDVCTHKVPGLNALTQYPDLPELVALCLEETEGGIEEFRAMTAPSFPLLSLGDDILTFFNLLGNDTENLRLSLVSDGQELAYWSDTIPDYLTVKEQIEALGITVIP